MQDSQTSDLGSSANQTVPGQTPKLSLAMLAAVEHARAHGGRLVRYPGGFWSRDGLMEHAAPWWGTPTVQALVTRGVAEYTEWQEGRSGRFPIAARLFERSDS